MTELTPGVDGGTVLEVRTGRGRLIGVAIACVAMTAGSIWALAATAGAVLVRDAMLVVGIGFFGLGAVVLAARAVTNAPFLVLDDHGLTVRGVLGRIGPIPWTDIAGAERTQYQRQPMVVIDVVPDWRDATWASPWRTPGLIVNEWMVGTPIGLSPAMLGPRSDEVIDLIAQHAEAAPPDHGGDDSDEFDEFD